MVVELLLDGALLLDELDGEVEDELPEGLFEDERLDGAALLPEELPEGLVLDGLLEEVLPEGLVAELAAPEVSLELELLFELPVVDSVVVELDGAALEPLEEDVGGQLNIGELEPPVEEPEVVVSVVVELPVVELPVVELPVLLPLVLPEAPADPPTELPLELGVVALGLDLLELELLGLALLPVLEPEVLGLALEPVALGLELEPVLAPPDLLSALLDACEKTNVL